MVVDSEGEPGAWASPSAPDVGAAVALHCDVDVDVFASRDEFSGAGVSSVGGGCGVHWLGSLGLGLGLIGHFG